MTTNQIKIFTTLPLITDVADHDAFLKGEWRWRNTAILDQPDRLT